MEFIKSDDFHAIIGETFRFMKSMVGMEKNDSNTNLVKTMAKNVTTYETAKVDVDK